MSIHVAIGHVFLQQAFLDIALSNLTVQVDDVTAQCSQAFKFHSENPFVESISFAVDSDKPAVKLRLCLLEHGTGNIVAYAKMKIEMDSDLCNTRMKLELLKPTIGGARYQHMRNSFFEGIADRAKEMVSYEAQAVGSIEIKLTIADHDLEPLSQPGALLFCCPRYYCL